MVKAVPLSEGTVDVRAVDKGAVAVPLVGLLPHVLTRKERVKGSEAWPHHSHLILGGVKRMV